MIFTTDEFIGLLKKADIKVMDIDISITENVTQERQGFYTDMQKGYANARIVDRIKDKVGFNIKAEINEITAFVGFERG